MSEENTTTEVSENKNDTNTEFKHENEIKEDIKEKNSSNEDEKQSSTDIMSTIETLENTLREKKKELNDVKVSNQNKVRELKEKNKNLEEEISDLEKKESELDQQFEEKKETWKNTTDESEELRQTIQSYKEKNQILEKEKRESETEIENMKKEIEDLRNQVENTRNKLENQTNKLNELQNQHDEASEQSQISSNAERSKELQKEINDLEEKLEKEKEDAEIVRKNLQKCIKLLNMRLRQVNEKIELVRKRFVEMNRDELTAPQEYSILLTKSHEIRALIDLKKSTVSFLEAELAQMEELKQKPKNKKHEKWDVHLLQVEAELLDDIKTNMEDYSTRTAEVLSDRVTETERELNKQQREESIFKKDFETANSAIELADTKTILKEKQETNENLKQTATRLGSLLSANIGEIIQEIESKPLDDISEIEEVLEDDDDTENDVNVNSSTPESVSEDMSKGIRKIVSQILSEEDIFADDFSLNYHIDANVSEEALNARQLRQSNNQAKIQAEIAKARDYRTQKTSQRLTNFQNYGLQATSISNTMTENSNSDVLLTEEMKSELQKGVHFAIHKGGWGTPKRMIGVDQEFKHVEEKEGRKMEKIPLSSITQIVKGCTTKNLQKQKKNKESLCFSIVSPITTLDLEASSEHERDKWASLFSTAMLQAKK